VFLVGDPASPTVKVIDFGISKVDDGSGSHLTPHRHDHGDSGLHAPGAGARGQGRQSGGRLRRGGDPLSRAHGQAPVRLRRRRGGVERGAHPGAAAAADARAEHPAALELCRAARDGEGARGPAGEHGRARAELLPFAGEFAAVALDAAPSGPGAAPVNVTAATLLSPARCGRTQANPTVPQLTSSLVERATREARWARPKIALLTLALAGFAALVLADALLSLVLWAKPAGSAISSTERAAGGHRGRGARPRSPRLLGPTPGPVGVGATASARSPWPPRSPGPPRWRSWPTGSAVLPCGCSG
jgi:hypothetical protein